MRALVHTGVWNGCRLSAQWSNGSRLNSEIFVPSDSVLIFNVGSRFEGARATARSFVTQFGCKSLGRSPFDGSVDPAFLPPQHSTYSFVVRYSLSLWCCFLPICVAEVKIRFRSLNTAAAAAAQPAVGA